MTIREICAVVVIVGGCIALGLELSVLRILGAWPWKRR